VKSVPAGRYGKAALEHFGAWHLLETRLAQTENVRAALAFVARGEAPLGIVYASDAKEEPGVSVVAAFPPQSHPPIVYPAARVKASVNPDATAFLDFLTSAAGQKIFASHGFLPTP
jgi:molybdate transport system substrate-binding protein